LPLLIPMSRVAGILSSHIAANLLHKDKGGKGKLIGGLPGVKPAKVLIIGGGTVGYNACVTALNLNAEVTVVDVNTSKLNFYYEKFRGAVKTLPSYPDIILNECRDTDIMIGSVLIPGSKTPKIIKKEYINQMEKGSVFIDVAIDQGGSSETSRPTTHEHPIYISSGVIHYCVTNIPSLVAESSTIYLSNEILPYVLMIAKGELETHLPLKNGLNTKNGKLLIKF
ncbi:MAG: alanine dehydrogenase, partial [Thermodesulfobacteriota bacterium]